MDNNFKNEFEKTAGIFEEGLGTVKAIAKRALKKATKSSLNNRTKIMKQTQAYRAGLNKNKIKTILNPRVMGL